MGDPVGVLASGGFEDGSRDRRPVHAVRRARHAPSVRAEPVAGVPGTTEEAAKSSIPKSFQSTRNTRFERPRPQAAFLVSWLAPGVSPPSPSTVKTLDLASTGQLQRQRLAGGRRHPVAGRPGVGLEEQRLARHLRVAGQAAAMAKRQEVART